MLEFKRLQKRARSLVVGAAATGMILGNVASVAALSDSSLLRSDPRASETGVTYTFDSSGYTATAINCVSLTFNTSADGTGSVPAGMVTTGASLDAGGSLITEASWTEDFATNGTLDLTFGAGETPAASGDLVFTGITNGSDTGGTTFYALLNTYTNTDCTTGQTDSVTVAFVNKEGELVQLTIDPTLTFTCAGITADTIEAVNGDVITHDSNASGINYENDVTAAANGVSAHDLAVTTNASGGYVVYIRHTGSMQNSNGDTIDNHTGTNNSPSDFSAVGTESWGYTTEDTTLSAIGDGIDRFTTPAGDFAGFTTSNEEVIVNTAAVAGTETTRVGHQVGIASTTEAGTYQTTIVYTIVSTF